MQVGAVQHRAGQLGLEQADPAQVGADEPGMGQVRVSRLALTNCAPVRSTPANSADARLLSDRSARASVVPANRLPGTSMT